MMDYLTFFSVLVLLVYGFCCSALLIQLRMALSVLLGAFVQGGIYCPICVGFWAAVVLTALGLFPGDLADYMTWVRAVAFSVAGIHLTKSLFPRFLEPNLEQETELVELLRNMRRSS